MAYSFSGVTADTSFKAPANGDDFNKWDSKMPNQKKNLCLHSFVSAEDYGLDAKMWY